MSCIVALLTDPEDSQPALTWAVDYAKEHQSTLHVVLSNGDLPATPSYVSPSKIDNLRSQLAPVDAIMEEVTADPARQVLELARVTSSDLVVLGLQVRSSTLKFVLGSYIRDVIQHATCPVVSIRNQDS